MLLKTKLFGDIERDDLKVIHFPKGIVGFPDLKEFSLVHEDKGTETSGLNWLLSLDEPAFAMPVIDPYLVKPDYSPKVDAGKVTKDLNAGNVMILVTMTIPHDIEKLSVNLMAPIIINVDTRMGVQAITDGNDYPVKFPVYEILHKNLRSEES